MLEAAFPSLDSLRHRYNILKRIPILLPLMWVWRWIDAFIFRRENVKIYSSKVKTVMEENVSEYEKNLLAVGLDFKFEEDKDL